MRKRQFPIFMNCITAWLVILLATQAVCVASTVRYQENTLPVNQVTLDVFVREDSERSKELLVWLKDFVRQRPGLDVVVHDVDADPEARRCLIDLFHRHNIKAMGVPALHVLNRFHAGYEDTPQIQQKIASLLDLEVFVRESCPHCRDAKAFLSILQRDWPAIRVVTRDISTDDAARDRLAALAEYYQVRATSVPAFHLCRRLKVGYQGADITGRELESMLRVCAKSVLTRKVSQTREPPGRLVSSTSRQPPGQKRTFSARFFPQFDRSAGSSDGKHATDPMDPSESSVDQLDSLDSLDSRNAPSGGSTDAVNSTNELEFDDVLSESREEIQVPLFGRLNVKRLGLPVFTFLIGLVDGFNPCAMWVLMFLLSVLVNVHDRRKMVLIAGTFIVVSGLAYFAFMAAWLNVFMLVGLDRPAQIVLGILAIVIGLVNIKDFFAFGKGLSLKIPESAKPGIYARVRTIVMAETLWGALTGAILLAVLVNVIELLCTAGLPALYTEILTLQQLSPMQNYLYLGLYIVAYMLDDTLLVTIVVVTLSKKKLQESHGRWLKLISGLVILVLGTVMLFAPTLLI